jgi:2-haloacid dehalogenase
MRPRVAVFDMLGTVLDERSGFRAATAAIDSPVDDRDELADRWLDHVSAQVAAIASGDASWRPWEDVIDQALAVLAPDIHRHHGGELGTVGRRLPPWPDSRSGVRAVRANYRVIALSNAGVLPLIHCSGAAGISWDAVFSAEMVHSAKPDPRVYRFLLDQLRLDPGDVVMVAAHPWDLRAAAEQGLRTAYVPRPGEGSTTDEDDFDWTAANLLELATVLPT